MMYVNMLVRSPMSVLRVERRVSEAALNDMLAEERESGEKRTRCQRDAIKEMEQEDGERWDGLA